MALTVFADVLRASLRNYPAAASAALGAHIKHKIGVGNQVKVVLYYECVDEQAGLFSGRA